MKCNSLIIGALEPLCSFYLGLMVSLENSYVFIHAFIWLWRPAEFS